jgi:hypothetical protein
MSVIFFCFATIKVNLLGELPKGVPLHFSVYFLPDTNEKKIIPIGQNIQKVGHLISGLGMSGC